MPGSMATVDNHRPERRPVGIAFVNLLKPKIAGQFPASLLRILGDGPRRDDMGGQQGVFHVAPAAHGGVLFCPSRRDFRRVDHPLIVTKMCRLRTKLRNLGHIQLLRFLGVYRDSPVAARPQRGAMSDNMHRMSEIRIW